MTADILHFPTSISPKAPDRPQDGRMTQAWARQHGPLIDTAMGLLRANDREFRARCRTIAETEGRPVLDQFAEQLDRLGAHLSSVVTNLAMVAKRTRRVVATGGLGA